MKVTIAKTCNTGKGIFAIQDVKKGEDIFTFRGKIVRDRDYARKLKCTLQIGKNLWVDPEIGSFGRYINHSCSPNAGIRGKQKIVAMKNIKRGEEVTLDYSITDDDPQWKIKCKCQSKNCRKLIKSIQFLPKGPYKKYEPFIPKFLQKSYKLTSN